MKFWDASAIVPLLVTQGHTDTLRAVFASDVAMVVWWGTRVEVVSALSRLAREGSLSSIGLRDAIRGLSALASHWTEVQASVLVRDRAEELLRHHPLRAGDALQLAAALVVSTGGSSMPDLVCCDDRLTQVAIIEGFDVLPAPAAAKR
ncbi:MAG: type II toxin-antitoxin system VapC family toxin [Myxococcales bacterium]|nr:type II toxin-antitoxin system VapC family toxin [Myxococcales bacterium]